ncbi:S41 family peptidase [Solicola gregarius]|uniref:S41 family peptidase n=1 Tax=Solicola gregarius TaxID=2908642 RepID=A0AA46TLU6_9ACTN|nr:S41 family peptidase [Solicola gregarius]UYM07503.1 S41 family peptidase [Solicola gregarius]
MTRNDIDLRDLGEQITNLVLERYILEEDTRAITASLDDMPAELVGAEPSQIARVLTRLLQRTNNDRHLRVRHRPGGAASAFDGPEHEARFAAEARRNAGGVRQTRLFDDGIGLLQIAPYLSPVHLAAPYIAAAFTLLSSVDGLIIDLRNGGGGTPETVALICGHLLGKEPVHLQDIVERGATPRQYWTAPAATRLDGPIRVLTSPTTFSGCEELAYDLQAQGRAVVIGETTGGGAHPVEAFKVGESLELHVPTAKSVNAVTGTNWEQVGVIPDRPCPSAEALDLALDDLRTA